VKTLVNGLTLTGKKMGLSEQVAKDIIEERISKLNTHKSSLLEYENNLKEMLRDEFPLSESSLSSLSYLQTGLNLNDIDVKLIHDKILSDPKLDDAFNWYERGYNQNSLGNFDLSIEYLTKAIEKNNEYSAAFAVRGLSYSKKNDLKTAIEDYTKAININKNWEITSALSLVYFDRAFASIDLSSIDFSYLKKGIDDYLKVIDLNPEEPTAYYNVALGYEKLKDFKEAVKWFIEALEKGYYNKASIFAWIVKCYSELGENKKRDEWIIKAKAEKVV
jgi:tetratricopeptide (TPR) repeat protein